MLHLFFINLFIPGIWLQWRATKGQYIISGGKFNQSPAGNLQDCMSRCLRYSANGKECRAITISTSIDKSCELRNHGIGNNGFTSDITEAWQSFFRPTWYLGKQERVCVSILQFRFLHAIVGELSIRLLFPVKA